MFKKLLFVLICMFMIFGLVSCGNADYAPEYKDGDSGDVAPATDENDLFIQDTSRKIFYTVETYVRAKNVKETASSLNALVKEYGGYIELSSGQADDEGEYSRITYKYRIPTNKLTDFVSDLDEGYTVTSKTMTSQDITNKYNETEATIETLQASREIYAGMLEKATTIDEVVKIQQYISEIDSQLLQYSKQKNTYDELVNYSIVNVTISQKYEYKEPTFMSEYGEYLVNFFEVVFEIIMYSLPFGIFPGVVLGIIFIVKACKKRKENKQNQE